MLSLSGYTEEQLQAGREYAASFPMRMAEECLKTNYGFASHVTDKEKEAYRDQRLKDAQDILAGKRDHILAVAQKIHYRITGECPALLP